MSPKLSMLMVSRPLAATAGEREVLAQARGGDEAAFARLVEPYRAELHAHCYRMLASVHDAEDALQETMLRGWRGLASFEGRSTLRSWLYRIATNTCLNHLARRPKRVLPIDYGPASDGNVQPGDPIVETVWLEPYPDEILGVEDGYAAPEARYERRESVELAFIAALQHLAPNQRAVLILREVLGFSAKETAELLDTTVASVNSALQRARAGVEERIPERSQQTTLRELGDHALRELVERYVDAWERNDVEAFTSMLTADATFSMPPLRTWYRGPENIEMWARTSSMTGDWRWKATVTRANGQPALAFYAWDDDAGAHLPFALCVLGLRGDRVSDVTAFITRSIGSTDPATYTRFPDEKLDARRLESAFGFFRLPQTLP
jgi:RNA polymerase sigma-70 factor, ECF subfamily